MKKLMALLLALICLFGSAVSESPATPTDLVEIDDDDWGEITIKFERKVYITMDKKPEYIGDTMTLTATLVNFKDGDKYTISWQYAIELPDWLFVEGEHEQVFTIIITPENANYWWRALVEMEGDE